MASKVRKKSASLRSKSGKTKKTTAKRKKAVSKPKIPSIINSEEDIDLILGLPTEAFEEKKAPKLKKRKLLIEEKPINVVEKELELKQSQLLAEIKRQSSDEERWIKVRDKMKKELEALLAKKKSLANEIEQYEYNNAGLLKELKKTNKDIEQKKSKIDSLLSEVERKESEAEGKRQRLEEKEKAWNQRDQNLDGMLRITENKEKALIKKKKELVDEENLIKSNISNIEEKKKHLAELMNLKKNLEKREQALEKDIANLQKQEQQSTVTLDELNQEKSKFENMKQEFLEKEKSFIEQEQMFVAKNKELADKTRDIEKKEKKLESDVAVLEDKKQALSASMDKIAVKAAMMRAEAKEKRKNLLTLDKAWIKTNKDLDARKPVIKNSIIFLDKKINEIEAAAKENSQVLDNLKQKEEYMKRYGPKIKLFNEKYDMLRKTEESLKAERQNLMKIRDDIAESRILLQGEEKSIVARVDRLEKDEAMLRRRENEVVNKIGVLEETRNILKKEENKLLSKLKDIAEREKAIHESQKNLQKAKRILEIDLGNKAKKLLQLRKVWVSSEDTIKKLKSTVGAEKMIVEDIFEIKDDIAQLKDKELEITKLVRQMEISRAKLEKTEKKIAEKEQISEKRIAEKEQKLKEHEASVKAHDASVRAQHKDTTRIMKLNTKLSDKIDSAKSLIKKLPQLKRDMARTERTYEKEAAKLDKVTIESLAKREMLKDFEARLIGWEEQLSKKDESLKRREQLIVNMEYNVLKEEDEIESERFKTYMESELGGLPEQAGTEMKKPVSMVMEEEPVLSEDMIPKGPESVDVMIARAQGLVKASAIEDAERLCDEIESISKEEQFSSEDLKKIEYSLMEIKTDIKLARLG